jgi:hypothetical protein
VGVWGGFFNPPAPPTKQLVLPRWMNLLVNPFTKQYLAGQDSPQKVFFSWGGKLTIDGVMQSSLPPQWPMIEFSNPQLGPMKTGRSRILLPEDFVLLNYFASATSNVQGGFRVMVYDVNRRRPITIRPANFNTLAGQGAAPLFQQRPYPFGRTVAAGGMSNPPMAKITIVNLESVANGIQFGFFGIIVPGYQQP